MSLLVRALRPLVPLGLMERALRPMMSLGPIAAGGRSPLDLMERALRPSLVPLEPDWCRFAGPMLPSSSSLTHGMLRALRSMGPIASVGPIAMGLMPLGPNQCRWGQLDSARAGFLHRYVPLHHGGEDDAVVVDGFRAAAGDGLCWTLVPPQGRVRRHRRDAPNELRRRRRARGRGVA